MDVTTWFAVLACFLTPMLGYSQSTGLTNAERAKLLDAMFIELREVARAGNSEAQSTLEWLQGLPIAAVEQPDILSPEKLVLKPANPKEPRRLVYLLPVGDGDGRLGMIGTFFLSGNVVARVRLPGTPVTILVNPRAACSPKLRAALLLQMGYAVRLEAEESRLPLEALADSYRFLGKQLDLLGGKPFQDYVAATYEQLVADRVKARKEPGRFFPADPYQKGLEGLDATLGKSMGAYEVQLRETYVFIQATLQDIDFNLGGSAELKAARRKEFIDTIQARFAY